MGLCPSLENFWNICLPCFGAFLQGNYRMYVGFDDHLAQVESDAMERMG